MWNIVQATYILWNSPSRVLEQSILNVGLRVVPTLEKNLLKFISSIAKLSNLLQMFSICPFRNWETQYEIYHKSMSVCVFWLFQIIVYVCSLIYKWKVRYVHTWMGVCSCGHIWDKVYFRTLFLYGEWTWVVINTMGYFTEYIHSPKYSIFFYWKHNSIILW